MSLDLNCKDVTAILRKDFDSLWKCRERGDTLEIITPFSTATQKFISVFITVRERAFIVTDGGWLRNELDLYEISENEDSDYDFHLEYFGNVFGISKFLDRTGEKFFFKKCEDENLLSSAVYDVSNFLSSVVNSLSLPRLEKAEKEHKKTFTGHANEFIVAAYPRAELRFPIEGLKTARFSAAIVYPSQLSLVIYVTGSRHSYFSTDLKRAIINFELVGKSRFNPMVKAKVALINNEADGYSASRNEELIPLLVEHGAKPVSWTERDLLKTIL